MLEKVNIEKVINKMSNDFDENIKILRNEFGSLGVLDDTNQTLLHILVDNKYDENKCYLAIQSLLNLGMDPNAKDIFNYIFIQTALYAGYSEEFILNIIKAACCHGLNVNHVDGEKDTIMHTAIYSDDYNGEVINIYKTLLHKNFNPNVVDHDNRNLLEAMLYQNNISGKFSKGQIEEFKELFTKPYNLNIQKDNSVKNVQSHSQNNNGISQLSSEDIKKLEEFGTILNKKKYFSSPCIGREKELKKLIITLFQEKKNPLIVGESGVGKTALVDELAYRIQNGNAHRDLKDKIILEIDPVDIISVPDHQYSGTFEETMKKLMRVCEKYEVILFIDEIHTIYGVGATKSKSLDMAAILKRNIDRSNLMIIGTTTNVEYETFFSNDALKRRFEKVSVNEPNKETLIQIITKVMKDYCIKNGISFGSDQIKQQIIDIIIEVTSKRHMDRINNPDASISIIDKAFAYSRYDDDEYIKPEHFIESLDDCDRLSDYSKEQAINKLKNLKDNPRQEHAKILKIDFNRNK